MTDPASTTKLTSASGEYELLVAGDGNVLRIPLPKDGELVIGRGSDVGVSLPGDGVSRRHALLRTRGAEFTLEDLGSSNGTLLRGGALLPGRAEPFLPGESALVGDFALVLRGSKALEGQTLAESRRLALAALGDTAPEDRRELIAMIDRARSLGSSGALVAR